MKKVSSSLSDKLIIKFVIKSAVLSVLSVVLLSFIASEIYCRLDVGTQKINVISVIVYALSAVIVSFFSVSGFKNNGALIGIISQAFLILYSLINLIFNSNTLLLFGVKLLISLAFGAAVGMFRVRKNSEFKI